MKDIKNNAGRLIRRLNNIAMRQPETWYFLFCFLNSSPSRGQMIDSYFRQLIGCRTSSKASDMYCLVWCKKDFSFWTDVFCGKNKKADLPMYTDKFDKKLWTVLVECPLMYVYAYTLLFYCVHMLIY